MRHRRRLAYLVLVSVLIALLVVGALHWRSQFQPTSSPRTPMRPVGG